MASQPISLSPSLPNWPNTNLKGTYLFFLLLLLYGKQVGEHHRILCARFFVFILPYGPIACFSCVCYCKHCCLLILVLRSVCPAVSVLCHLSKADNNPFVKTMKHTTDARFFSSVKTFQHSRRRCEEEKALAFAFASFPHAVFHTKLEPSPLSRISRLVAPLCA